MGAPLENKNGCTLRSPESIRKAAAKYAGHLAAGFPKEFFYYVDGRDHCDYEALERYLKEPEFKYEAILIKNAELDGLRTIYTYGINSIKGGKDGSNNYSPKTWEIIMRNKGRKFGWDPASPEKSDSAPHHLYAVWDYANVKDEDFEDEDKCEGDGE